MQWVSILNYLLPKLHSYRFFNMVSLECFYIWEDNCCVHLYTYEKIFFSLELNEQLPPKSKIKQTNDSNKNLKKIPDIDLKFVLRVLPLHSTEIRWLSESMHFILWEVTLSLPPTTCYPVNMCLPGALALVLGSASEHERSPASATRDTSGGAARTPRAPWLEPQRLWVYLPHWHTLPNKLLHYYFDLWVITACFYILRFPNSAEGMLSKG